MMFYGVIAALAVIVVGIILLAKGCSGGTDALAGTWEFDGTTTYSFDGRGSGAMELPSISYDFTYTIDGNKLMIDYANKSVRYSEYEFTVDGNTLTLIGGEGTVGGTYELKRSSKKSEELIEKLSQMSSVHRASRWPFWRGGMKYTPISISPEQAQFLETRKFQINEIARIFRVPPHMVGDLEKSSFSNIEQ